MKKILLLLLIVFQCDSLEEAKTIELPTKVVNTIEKRINNNVFPGISIALIDSSGVYYFNFGKTKDGGHDVDEFTIYEIGSISKVFTSLLLANQILEGELTINDAIDDFLPDDIQVNTMGEYKITLGSLTDHTSGLPGLPTNFAPTNPANPYVDYTESDLIEFISEFEPIREVGDKYEYSNLGSGLLGYILANKKKSSYEELLIKTITDPLDMDDTRIEFTQRMKKNLAIGHSIGVEANRWDFTVLAGAGAIRSSTSDMAKFIAANLGFTKNHLSDSMILSHQIRHDKANGMSVAMAWHVKKGTEGDVFWHNGGTGGYRSFAGFVKETGKGVVILANSSEDPWDIGFNLLDPGSELEEPKFKNDAIDLPESTLLRYVGVYELQPGFAITITKDGKQLFGIAPGIDKFEIYPESETSFFLTVVQAEILFQLKGSIVEGLTFIQGGYEMSGPKIE